MAFVIVNRIFLTALPILCLVFAWTSSARAEQVMTPFHPKSAVFAFANETARLYAIDDAGRLSSRERGGGDDVQYAKRCFVMTRAALQFYRFARFDPQQKPSSPAEYVRLIQRVCRIPVWMPSSRDPDRRIVIPGYRDLRAFSQAHGALLQQHMGEWWPTYLRVGNWRMGMGHPRAGQAALAAWLLKSMRAGQPRALYLARFPHMNHAVIVYGAKTEANGQIAFQCYDPNYLQGVCVLRYDPARRSFDLERRFYFPGGQVNAMRIYLSPIH